MTRCCGLGIEFLDPGLIPVRGVPPPPPLTMLTPEGPVQREESALLPPVEYLPLPKDELPRSAIETLTNGNGVVAPAPRPGLPWGTILTGGLILGGLYIGYRLLKRGR